MCALLEDFKKSTQKSNFSCIIDTKYILRCFQFLFASKSHNSNFNSDMTDDISSEATDDRHDTLLILHNKFKLNNKLNIRILSIKCQLVVHIRINLFTLRKIN